MTTRDRAENREWFPSVTSLVILTLPATSVRFATVAVINVKGGRKTDDWGECRSGKSGGASTVE